MMMTTYTPADPGTLVEITYDLPFTCIHTTIWSTLAAHDVVEQHTQIEGAACIRVRVAASTLNLVVQALDDTHTMVRVHPMPTPYLNRETITPATASPSSVETAHALLDICERALQTIHYPRATGAVTSASPQLQATVRNVLLWCRYFVVVQTDPDELALIDAMVNDIDMLNWSAWATKWKITDPPLREQACGDA